MVGVRRGARWGLGLSIGWLALVLVADLATPGPAFALTVLYAIGPLIACAVLAPTPTAAVASLGSLMAVASGAWNDTWGTVQQTVRIADVVFVGAASVAVAGVRARREQQVARLTAIADVAQRAILPVLPEHAGPVGVAARYLSAGQDSMVGGDLYDCYRDISRTPGVAPRVRFIVGDVRGKGIAGVEQAARVIRAFRQSAATEPTLPMVAQAMDEYLSDFFGPEEFVTVVLADVSDPSRVELVSCGHPPALLHRAGGPSTLVDAPPGLPLGMRLTDIGSYQRVLVPWTKGDRLLLYTDGLSEARDRRGEFLSPLALDQALNEPERADAIESVMTTVTRHIPGARLGDDLALLLLECESPSAAPHTAHVAQRLADAVGSAADPIPAADSRMRADSGTHR